MKTTSKAPIPFNMKVRIKSISPPPKKPQNKSDKCTSWDFFLFLYFPINRTANAHFRRMSAASWWWSGACAGDAGPCGAEGTWSWNPVGRKTRSMLTSNQNYSRNHWPPQQDVASFQSRQMLRQYTWSGRGTWPFLFLLQVLKLNWQQHQSSERPAD